jgi:predicted nucleotidyltransferase
MFTLGLDRFAIGVNFLVCDPQYTLLSAHVHVNQGYTRSERLQVERIYNPVASQEFCGLRASETCHRVTKPRAIIKSMQLTDEQRDAIIAWAERTPQVQAVMLFGSRCKGTARPDSDVDLAITMMKGRWERRFKNYRDNVNAWERELTDAVGLTVFVRSRHPALGPEVPAGVKECSIKLWRRSR